jgi:hypothetical protein
MNTGSRSNHALKKLRRDDLDLPEIAKGKAIAVFMEDLDPQQNEDQNELGSPSQHDDVV